MSGALHQIRNAGMPVAARLSRRTERGDPRRLLVLQPDHIGDIILSQPAVKLLREKLPDHELIAVVGPWSEEIARMAWPVDRFVTLSYPGFTRSDSGRPWNPYTQLVRDASRLRDLSAGAALVLRSDAWWAAWLARMSVSGPVYGADHPLSRPFLTHITAPESHHRTLCAIDVANLAADGERTSPSYWDMSPSLTVPGPAVEQARQLRQRHGIREPYFVFHPGAGAQVKLWPATRWKALASEVRDMQVVLTGSPDERGLCTALAGESVHVVNLAGETDLGTLAGILRTAKAVVGTDNGAMHLAGAVGTPTVRLFGPSDPAIYGPYPDSPQHRVVSAGWQCPRCGDLSPGRRRGCGCMLAITVDQVREAIDQVQAVPDAA